MSSGAGSSVVTSLEVASLVTALLASALVSLVAASVLVAGSLELAPVEGATEVTSLDVSITTELLTSGSEGASLVVAKGELGTDDSTSVEVASVETPGSEVTPSVPTSTEGDVAQPETSPNPTTASARIPHRLTDYVRFRS